MEDKQYYAVEEIDFQNYWLLLRRRWLPALFVFSGCVILAGFYSTTRPSVYEATGKLLFQRSATSTLTGVGENLGQLQSLSFENSPLDTQAEIIKSDGIIQQAIANLNLQNEDGEPMLPGDIAGDLDLTAVDGTDILTVSYDSEDPQQAAALVNELMRLYIEDDIRSNRADAAAAREFIEQELPSAESTVNQAAEALRQFKDQNGIVELQNEAAVVVDAVAEMDQLVVAANAELADVSTRSIELAQQLNMTSEQAINVSALSQAPGVQQALTSLQTIQAELTRQGARYTTEHPIIENLQLQEAEAEGLLQERVAQVVGNGVDIAPGQLQMGDVQEFLTQELVEAEVNRLSLASRVDSLLKTRNEYLSWSRAFPQLEKIQRQLENRLNAAQVNYEALLLRQQEVQLAENQTVGNARILDQAGVPSFPSSGSSKIYIVLGGIGGLMLGVAIAFLLDLFDRSLKTIKESQSLLGYSLLGLIPKYRLASSHQAPEGTDIATPLTQSFAEYYPVVADAYQMLQANLKFVSSDKRMKVIVVTSSVNREGRTSVSAQLALTISQSGRKVLLMEADMRSPSQHHVWKVLNNIGLSHVLVREGELEEALQPVANNLTLMTAGVTPPNPLALLDSEQMVNLMHNLAQDYDTLVIDTPPLVSAADAAILGKMADGVIFVVRPRGVDSASATAAKSLLDRSGARVLGIVANAVDSNTEHEDYAPYTAVKSEKKMDKGIRRLAALGRKSSN